MRGHDEQTTHMVSYLLPEQRVPADHPLRAVRALTVATNEIGQLGPPPFKLVEVAGEDSFDLVAWSSRLLKNSVEWDRQIDPGVLPCSQHR